MTGSTDKGAGPNRPPAVDGYVRLPRSLAGSDLMQKPPLYLRLFVHLLYEARYKPDHELRRGQLRTSLGGIRDAVAWKIGFRTERPSRDETRGIIAYLKYTGLIETTKPHTKPTNDIIITICNYDTYSPQKNTKPHTKPTLLYKDIMEEGSKKIKRMKDKDSVDTMKPVSRSRFTGPDLELAELLKELMTRNNPTRKQHKGETERWANDIRLMRERDGRTAEQIRVVIEFSQNDPFWRQNVLSGGSLKKHFDQLTLKMKGGRHGNHEHGDGGQNGRDRHRSGGGTRPSGDRIDGTVWPDDTPED